MAVFDTMHAIGRDETLLLCDGREIATFANDTPFNAEYFADLANLVEASLAYVDCFDTGDYSQFQWSSDHYRDTCGSNQKVSCATAPRLSHPSPPIVE